MVASNIGSRAYCQPPRPRSRMGCKLCHDLDRSTLAILHRSHKLKNRPFSFGELKQSVDSGCLGCNALKQGIEMFGFPPSMVNRFYLQCINSISSIFLFITDLDNTVLEFSFLENNFNYYDADIKGSLSTVSLDLEHAVRWIRGCLRTCDEFHPACTVSNSTLESENSYPARLLELRQGDNKYVYLNDNGTKSVVYMTLSHCWGEMQPITTTSNTIQQRRDGIIVSSLPQTFQDTINITRHLGIDYLWVDSLCIVQDNVKDWNVESAKMATIYSRSFLNLSATSSSDGTGGYFRDMQAKNTQALQTLYRFQTVRAPKGDELGIFVRLRDQSKNSHVDLQNMSLNLTYESMKASSPLLSRAWAYQERLLSSRNVNFHRDEMVWECTTSLSCECGKIIDSSHQRRPVTANLEPAGFPTDAKRLASFTESRRSQWYKLVWKYSGLSITYPKDRLPALAGLARNFSLLLKDEYVAGLWKQDMWYGLQWGIIPGNNGLVPRRAAGGAPSWSWASVEYRSIGNEKASSLPQPTVYFDGWNADRVTDRSSVLSVNCMVLSSENPFGEVVAGELVIQAKYLELLPSQTVRPKDGFFELFRVRFLTTKFLYGKPYGAFMIDVDLQDAGFTPVLETTERYSIDATRLRCISMGTIKNWEGIYRKDPGDERKGEGDEVPELCVSHKCLLIRRVADDSPVFERVAMGTVYDHENLFAQAETSIFTIV